MSNVRRVLTFAAVAALLAGCGGGSRSSSVAPPVTLESAQRTTQSVPAITPTLYVSGKGTVYAYNRDDAGNTPPKSRHGSFFNGGANTAVAGIATDRKGTLYVLVNYGTAAQGPSSPSCDVQSFAFTALTTDPPTLQYQCGPSVFFGAGIQSAPGGEVDVLDTIDNTGQTGFQVERFSPQTGLHTTQILKLVPNQAYIGLAAGAAGNLFTLHGGANTSTVNKYPAGATGNAAIIATASDGSLQSYSAIAAGRGQVYVAGADIDGNNFLNVYNKTLTSVTQYGTLPNITALALDQSGNLYVGITGANGTVIEVFPPGTTDFTMPAHVLNNPVRRGNPAGAVITGIAIAE